MSTWKHLLYGESAMEAALQDVQRPEYQKSSTTKWYAKNHALLAAKRRNFVEWVITMSKADFPVMKEYLMNKFPFKDGRPGRKWCKAFLKRHNLSLRTPQNLTSSRIGVSSEKIMAWFEEVHKYIVDNGLESILLDPNRIFNADETASFLNLKGSRILAQKEDKTIYQQVNSDDKEFRTVLVTGNATGRLCTPLVCLNMKDSHKILLQKFLHTRALENPPMENIPLSVLLLIDGHLSHLTLHTSKFCSDNGIVCVALLPNSTNILQPMDVCVFKPLKHGWGKGSSYLEAKLLDKTINECVWPEHLQHTFRRCGLYPWDAVATDYSKVIPQATCSGVTRHPESADKPNSYVGICSQLLDTYLGAEKIKEFEAAGNDWLGGGTEDKSLFRYWRYLKDSMSRETEHNTNSGTPPIEDHELTEYETCPSAEDVEIPADVPAYTSHVIVPGRPHLPAHVTPAEVGDSSHPPTNPFQAATSPHNIVVGNHSVSAGPSIAVTPTGKMIPSPFKCVLFWAGPQLKKKSKITPKEKIPTVARPTQWQELYTHKEEAKKELLIRKEERIAERNRKKTEKE
ncbi:hypothetical protein PR048_023412 [Dryococelus australis]|uniref:DDE-1 domain-containing protein n=1 Tax=Dryococelus australis TaxID=614101 RepID=A0ABQ9GU15_9NEOP|nr:hypothetical protein PR048_023412 [Dryococelus australis]